MWEWLSFENGTAHRLRFLTAHLVLESLLIVVGFQLYSVVADRAPRHASVAFGRTDRILHDEHALGLSPELRMNTWWARSHLREVIGNFYYDGAHFIVTALVLCLLVNASLGVRATTLPGTGGEAVQARRLRRGG
jgi:hypothetical protein